MTKAREGPARKSDVGQASVGKLKEIIYEILFAGHMISPKCKVKGHNITETGPFVNKNGALPETAGLGILSPLYP